MEGVDSGGRSISDGWAHGRIKEAELVVSSNDNEMFKCKWEVTRKKEKATVYDNLVMTPAAAWKVKSLLECAGVKVPKGQMEVDEETLEGLECGVEITNENYEGKDRPKITGFKASDDEDDDEDEDEEDEEDEDEDEDEDDEDESDDEDDESDDDEDDEEEDEDDEEEEDEKPSKKSKSKKPAKGKKKKPKDEDEDEDDEDDEDDEEEEEEDDEDEDDEDEKPSKKSKKKPAKKPAKAEKGKKAAPVKGKGFKAGMKVTFEDDKGKKKTGVITSIDGKTIVVEDSKENEWELSAKEIQLAK